MYPWWALAARPYTRRELPGWGRLLKMLGAMPPAGSYSWDGAPTRTVRGKLHGYLMCLDLSNWSERLTYFLGRYYESHVQMLLQTVLRPGDHFVDIGANIGMITLTGARCVGSTGRVDSFEPNPACVSAIRHHLAINAIDHVVVHPVALAEVAGQLRLSLTSSHTGTATLATVEGVVDSFDVEVQVGDDVLADGPPIHVVKIDVEGFEMQVLCGLQRVLAQHRPMVITEFIETQFVLAGTSGDEIERLLEGYGYSPYAITTRRKWLRHGLALTSLTGGRPIASDVLWVHRDSHATEHLVRAGTLTLS